MKHSQRIFKSFLTQLHVIIKADMGTPPVFCVGRTQGSSRADTGEFFSDTGEFEGEFVLMGGVPGRSKQGVFLYERPQYIESY